jgi:hypothetical protein
MAQTTYTLLPAVGYAGFPYDSASTKDMVSAPAAEEIPFGVLVELQTDGTVRCWRGTGKLLGMAIGSDTRESGSFAIGASATYKQYSQVPVARRGRWFVQFESNAVGVALAAPNFWGPSDNSLTNAAKRGVATSRATAATTGAEIYAQTAGVLFWKAPAATDTVAIIELSLN